MSPDHFSAEKRRYGTRMNEANANTRMMLTVMIHIRENSLGAIGKANHWARVGGEDEPVLVHATGEIDCKTSNRADDCPRLSLECFVK